MQVNVAALAVVDTSTVFPVELPMTLPTQNERLENGVENVSVALLAPGLVIAPTQFVDPVAIDPTLGVGVPLAHVDPPSVAPPEKLGVAIVLTIWPEIDRFDPAVVSAPAPASQPVFPVPDPFT